MQVFNNVSWSPGKSLPLGVNLDPRGELCPLVEFFAHSPTPRDEHSSGNLAVIWCILPRFGILCQEKSGSPFPENDSTTERKFNFVAARKVGTQKFVCILCKTFSKHSKTFIPKAATL
jgi:hypothetical protein